MSWGLVHATEAAETLIIFAGAVRACARFASTGLRGRSLIGEFNKIRLSLGAYSFWGSSSSSEDVLRTAVAPGGPEIGQLAAIAAIRTLLYFLLTRQIAEERPEIAQDSKEPKPRIVAP